MAAKKVDAVWIEVDVASLPTELSMAHGAYKESYTAMKGKREAFEGAFEAQLRQVGAVPEGMRPVFTYYFGKLKFALVPDDRKPKAAAKPVMNLAAFIQAQIGGGRNA